MDLILLSDENRNDFIKENKPFIYNVVKGICNKDLNWNIDHELSLALIAFNFACSSYVEEMGNFYSYARVLIRTNLLDYIKKLKVSPYLIFGTIDANSEYIQFKNTLTKNEQQIENRKLYEEIYKLSEELDYYKLNFNMLTECCPAECCDKNKLLNLAMLCAKENFIMSQIKRKKQLPIERIRLYTNQSTEFIKRWDKYILIFSIILYNEEYYYIKSYFNIIIGEKNGN